MDQQDKVSSSHCLSLIKNITYFFTSFKMIHYQNLVNVCKNRLCEASSIECHTHISQISQTHYFEFK